MQNAECLPGQDERCLWYSQPPPSQASSPRNTEGHENTGNYERQSKSQCSEASEVIKLVETSDKDDKIYAMMRHNWTSVDVSKKHNQW